MNTLKSLAQKAKNRLKSAGLNVSTITNSIQSEEIIKKCAVSYKTHSYQKELEDDKLYPKIKALLEKDIDNPFPLRELVDNKIYKDLPVCEKEKYILQLSKRYLLLREKFLSERENL